MKWLLTADWQVKFANLDAAQRAHAQELEIIVKHNIQGHIDLGDMKDDFDPVPISVVKFQLNRKEAIHSAVTYDIALMGNHDMSGQTALDKNWMSIFDSVSGHNIQKPGVLHLGNCVFSCLPFDRNKNRLFKSAEHLIRLQKKYAEKNMRKILLFHCDISGASWNNLGAHSTSTSKITLKHLQSRYYDMCLGGHIHKYQKLADNAMFVGNPFCTDNGEIDQQKGFVVYDDETNETHRIKSRVPGIFSWAYVKANKPKLVPGTKIKATINCVLSENYHKALDKTASAIEERYPDCIAYVTPKFETVTQKDAIEIDPNSSDVTKIATYVKATVPEELLKKRKALIQYIATQLGNATSSGIRQSGKLIFESISARNVLSFRKLDFSFRNRGILSVKGKNNDAPWASNGAGKTNLLSMLPIAIASKTFKDQKNDQWASDDNKDKATLTLAMSDDKNRKLEIIRGRRPTKLKFLINGSDESVGRRHVGKKETQGVIEETIGYTFDTLANSVYIDSSLSNAFLTGTSTDRAKLIYQFQNMDRFKIARDRIAKEISLLNKQMDDASNQVEIAQELLGQLVKDIAKAKKKKESNSKALLEAKRTAKHNLDMSKRSLRQLETTKKLLENRIEKQSAATKESIEKALAEREVARGAVAVKEEEYDAFKSLEGAKKCPQCSQALTEAHKQVVLARLKKALGAKKTELKKIEHSLSTLDKQLSALEGPITKITGEIDKTDSLVDNLATKYEYALEAYKEGKTKEKEERHDISSLLRRRNKLQSKLARFERILVHLEKEQQFLKYAQEAMSRDGLPAFLNKLLCPQLNQAAAMYSELFIDKEIQVVFDIEDGQIMPFVINAHGAKSINGQSAGESAWAGIITSFALREIATPTNLLILDEPGNGLDTEAAKLFGSRLKRLKDRFETIIVVSHNQSILGALDSSNSVTVVKTHKISRLK